MTPVQVLSSHPPTDAEPWFDEDESAAIMKRLDAAGYIVVPKEPTEPMLNAARDWSAQKYGKPVGNDGAIGCYRSMIAAST